MYTCVIRQVATTNLQLRHQVGRRIGQWQHVVAVGSSRRESRRPKKDTMWHVLSAVSN